MGDKGLRLGLSVLRIGVIVAGVLLSYMITSRSGTDETFVEGQERYGALLDGLFYIIYNGYRPDGLNDACTSWRNGC